MDMSTSKDRKTASFSSGFCTSDAHQYKNNRINQVGSYRSFLMDKDLLKLPVETRRRIAMLICGTIRLFGVEDRYVETLEEQNAGSPRLKMRREFWNLLGMTMEGEDKDLFQFFLCEGFSLISEFMLHFHQDTKNDPSASYGGTYSIKAPIRLTQELLDGSKTIRLLAKRYNLSVGDILPVSFMVYSRKGCGDNTVRDVKMSQCLRGEIKEDYGILLKAVAAGINDIESTERNYSAKWDNPAKHLEELVMMKTHSAGLTENQHYGKKAKGDLRNFASVPTQFSGTYASHLPSYDKMSFWSIIVDLLIDIAVNVKTNLSATDVMGYVLFCSLECNGTVLPVGIISRRMRTSSTRLLFKTMIESDGMYYTLLRDSIEQSADRRSNIYGSSKGPRHMGHNRSFFDKPDSKGCPNPAGIPFFSAVPCYADTRENTSNHEWKYADEAQRRASFKSLRIHCKKLEKSFLELCKESFGDLSEPKKAPKKKKSNSKKNIPETNCSTAATRMSKFLKRIASMAGSGCGHIFSLNFIQLSACFGFLPTHLMTYSSVANVKSGGYKLIMLLYKDSGIKINPDKAQSLFESVVHHLRRIFTHNVSYNYVENMLCELWRGRPGKTVSKKDYFFFLPHRSNIMGGLQNFFRFQYESGSSMLLEILPIPRKVKGKTVPVVKDKVQLMQWEKKHLTQTGGVISWVENSVGTLNIGVNSIFTVDKTFGAMYYKCKNKKKRKVVETIDLTGDDLELPVPKKKSKS